MPDLHVTGLVELQKFLDTLPAKLEANIMRGALRAGMTVIKAEAMANVPVGPPSSKSKRLYGGYLGALRDSLRISTSVRGGVVAVYLKAGGKLKNGADVFYAYIVEGFWRHHTTSAYPITASKKNGRLWFGGTFRKTVMHPPIEPHPFLRPALDHKAQAALVAAGEYIKERLATKEGLDTAHIRVEGDE